MYEIHPLALIIPEMTEQEFADLRSDIQTNGQLDPCIKYENKILDGRHRYKACIDLGISPRTIEFDGDDPVAFVASKNLRRRHLTREQMETSVTLLYQATRKEVGVRGPGQEKAPSTEGASQKTGTAEKLSKESGISRATIERRSKELDELRSNPDNEALAEEIAQGKKTIKQARKEAGLSPKSKRRSARKTIREEFYYTTVEWEAMIENLRDVYPPEKIVQVAQSKEELAEWLNSLKSTREMFSRYINEFQKEMSNVQEI